LIVLLIVIALLVMGGWKGYRIFKLRMAIAEGRNEYEHGQLMRANFWAGRALEADPGNIDAARLLADVDAAQGNPAELALRMRIAQREPGNIRDSLALARSALRFGQREIALHALDGLPQDTRERDAEYHDLMGACAAADNELGLAESHFERAVQLAPDDMAHRVTLAAFRLAHGTDRTVRTEAARELAATPPALGAVSLYATRALLSDAVLAGDHARAQHFAAQLQAMPEHTFGDDLNCLDAALPGPGFPAALADIEHRAEQDPQSATATGDWLNAHAMSAETLRWIPTLPQSLQANLRVQMTLAQAYLGMQDWSGLAAWLGKCQWGDSDYLRRAMLIRCKRELGQPWRAEWDPLAAEVDDAQPDGLLLAQLLIGWHWRDEALSLLWAASRKPGTDTRALEYLWGLYSQTNDTAELMRVATAQIALEPENPTRKNNYAFLSLLLDGGSDHALRLAEEASESNPKVPEWAATYAYALHLAGRDADARKVMANLDPAALYRPGVALYYAIVLAGNGDNAKARESLARLNPSGMLPEEQKLAAALAQQLNVASR
jgi:Flp pilus assembly protein TadD